MYWLVPVHFCFMTLEQNKILDALGHFILGLTLIFYYSGSSSDLLSGLSDLKSGTDLIVLMLREDQIKI